MSRAASPELKPNPNPNPAQEPNPEPNQNRPPLPSAWINAREPQTRLWTALAAAPLSLLICDYDGTLAPFKADKMTAVPYPGVAERLEKLADLPQVRLALVSGRPVSELITLLPLAERLEIYGAHGREHRSATGRYHMTHASQAARAALDASAEELTRLGWGEALERKQASLAVHWRNLSPADQASLARTAQQVFEQIRAGQIRSETAHGGGPDSGAGSDAGDASVSVLPFESGMELRADGHTKAHAVQALLADAQALPAGSPTGVVAAYLGDDTTDEDAFGALGERGLSLLVREEPRPSLAGYWLRPPAQLLGFLDDWLRAAARS